MAISEQTKIQVLLDGRQASDQLKDLGKQAAALRIELAKAYQANDAGKVAEAEWELSKLDSRMKQLRKESVDVSKVLNNLSGATMGELSQSITAIDAKLKGKAIKKNSEEWNALVKARRRLVEQKGELRAEISGTDSVLRKSSNILNQHNLLLAGTATAAYKMIGGLRSCISAFNDYEESFQGVSSLTGLTGDALEFMKNKALETGGATLEGGIRVGQGATEILNAYKMIGSQRPELLKDGEALHSVTTEAIILSEAAKMDLQPAAKALTNSLNQFDASADQSRRFINTLAAGSQAGAGDINYLSQAIEKSGTTANLMGLEFEQLVALIETAAPKFNEAAVAGNSIDKVLMEMKSKQIGYRDGIFDVNVALEQLADRFAAGEIASNIFGKEHAKMVEVLVYGREEFAKYQEAVTGTNQAITQAAINTDTNKAKMSQLKAQMEALRIEVGEKLTPIMGGFTQAGIYGLKVFSPLVGIIGQYLTTSGLLALALTGLAMKSKILYGIELLRNTLGKESVLTGRAKILGMKAEIAAISAKAIFTKGATVAEIAHVNAIRSKIAATKAANAALAKTPWGLIAVGAAMAIGYIVDLVKNTNKLSDSQQRLNDIEKQHTEKLRDQTGQMSALYEQIKRTNPGSLERINLVDRLDDLLPGVIDKQEIYCAGLAELETSERSYRLELEKRIRIQENESKFADLEKQKMSKESMLNEQLKAINYIEERRKKLGDVNVMDDLYKGHQRVAEDIKKEIEEIQKKQDAISFGRKTPEKEDTDSQVSLIPMLKIDDTTYQDWEKAAEEEVTKEIEKNERLAQERTKQLEEQRKYREEILFNAKSDLEKEDLQYEERLKKAGLFGKKEISLQGKDAEILKSLHQEHQAKILKITTDADTKKQAQYAQSVNKEIRDKQAAHQREMTLLRIKNNEELALESLTDERRKALKEKHQASEKALTIKHTTELITLMQGILKASDIEGIDLSGKLFTPEEKQKLEDEILKAQEALSKLNAETAENKPKIEKPEKSDVDVLGMTIDDWDSLFTNLEAGKLSVENLQEAVKAVMNAWRMYDKLVSASEQRQLKQFEKNADKKKMELDKQLDAGKISQEQYNARVSQLDAELDAKKAEIENKQARRQKQMAISQVIMDTAVGIMKLWVSPGFPAASAMAIALAALGAVQIATIAAQPLPGAESGGYLNVVRSQDGQHYRAKDEPARRGYVDRPTVITGESGREFVVNDKAVSNPTVKPVLDVIDAAQKNGTIDRLNLTSLMPAILPGRTNGGTIGAEASTSTVNAIAVAADPEMKELLRRNIEMMQILADKRIEIPWYGKGGINEKMKKATKYEQQITSTR